ncbi:DUF885 domain-containing protein [Hellea balneolensis]|uniref:DUF885 domain-containing protein n=1 Tax=Hellea balneolensis TaxID=287478 RepID=UPI0003FA2341|nr:DUF885 domain-containing protein [Hellea balneolensis]
MRKFLILTTAALALTACQDTSPASTKSETPSIVEAAKNMQQADVNVRLNAWFEDKFMERARRYPQRLAGLGIKERMDEWNDPSRTFALEELDRIRQNMEELKNTFNLEDLDETGQLSYRLFMENSQNSLDSAKWWYHGYAFTQMFGPHSSIPTFLINEHPIENIEDAENYIKRLEGVEAFLTEIIKNSRASADKGIMPPKFVYDHVIRTTNNIVSGAPFDESDKLNLMLNDFKTKVEKLNLGEEKTEALYEQAITALLTSVKPAYAALLTEMEAQQAKANTDDGAWKLPDGADYYAYRLKVMTTTDMSAKDIHELGLQEVDRIHGEMRDIMKKVGYEGTLQEFFKYLQDEPRFSYEDSDAGREAYLKEATRIIDVITARLDEVFLRQPKAKLEVRRVEAFREKAAGKAFYSRGTPDGSRPGYYYANLYKITDMPKYQMEALAYHEGNPGHHMQLSIAQELEGIPKFRKHNRVTAYTEGWGLYSEYFPKEMGFYQDPYSDFGRLAMELWRAARLVVDTGLHDKKWTREEAIDYLTTNTPNPENDCIKAIERYIVMPGQATAYKIGMIKILDLREMAKEKLGDKFDIREYHDVVIASGPVPLNILEERVDAWVTSKS